METDVEAEPFLPAEGLEQYRSSLRERCGLGLIPAFPSFCGGREPGKGGVQA